MSNGNITTFGMIRINGINTSSTDVMTFYEKTTGIKLWNIDNSGGAFLKSLSITGGNFGIYQINNPYTRYTNGSNG